MANHSLKNKKIIISAGASGIGFAIAKVCLSKGAIVYLCDINEKQINRLRKHTLNNKRLFRSYCNNMLGYNFFIDLFFLNTSNLSRTRSSNPR